ncbi:MAG: HNH endonuclease [Bacilli bacterium]|jgi:hypothetical protein
MKRIPLTKGQFALVDDEDFDYLSRWKWQAQKKHYGGFGACRRCACPLIKQYCRIYMHRQILSCPKGLEIDHKDLNPLNNQKSNLRICTGSQNCMNRLPRKNTSSKYKGVSWMKRNKKWIAYVCINRITIYLGIYNSESNAAKVYDKAAKKYHGEFARLNFKESNNQNTFT